MVQVEINKNKKKQQNLREKKGEKKGRREDKTHPARKKITRTK
jgi:hypothetical protein